MFPQQPRFENFPGKKMIGMRTRLSLASNKTIALWQSFMPRRKEIPNATGNDVFSVQLYDASYFKMFNPAAEFEKWAAVEVEEQKNIPQGMEALNIPPGLYAVFIYRGGASEAAPFFTWVFRDWLPASGYVLDDRPHFEILGEKYKKDSVDSEEEVWVPVKRAIDH
ncbi:MAG TPA: GyrI-like domain-containing protein [Bacteroidia bacterium]|jgi:AraC family transcriptional regulator